MTFTDFLIVAIAAGTVFVLHRLFTDDGECNRPGREELHRLREIDRRLERERERERERLNH